MLIYTYTTTTLLFGVYFIVATAQDAQLPSEAVAAALGAANTINKARAIVGLAEKAHDALFDRIEAIASRADLSERRNLQNTPEELYYDESWTDLPQEVQNAYVILGYNEELWEGGEDSSTGEFEWNTLTAEQQEAALFIGYTEEIWCGADEEEETVLQPVSVETPKPVTASPITDIPTKQPVTTSPAPTNEPTNQPIVTTTPSKKPSEKPSEEPTIIQTTPAPSKKPSSSSPSSSPSNKPAISETTQSETVKPAETLSAKPSPPPITPFPTVYDDRASTDCPDPTKGTKSSKSKASRKAFQSKSDKSTKWCKSKKGGLKKAKASKKNVQEAAPLNYSKSVKGKTSKEDDDSTKVVLGLSQLDRMKMMPMPNGVGRWGCSGLLTLTMGLVVWMGIGCHY